MATLKNPKHEAFCREVAGGLSYDLAWLAIGNNPAHRNTGRLARQDKIQARIAELRTEFNRASAIGLRFLQEKLIPLATSDVTRYFETRPGGGLKLRDVTSLPPELRCGLSELTISDKGKVSVKLHNKLHAIDSLIKTIGGFAPEKLEVTGKDGEALVSPPAGLDGMAPFEIMRETGFMVTIALRNLAERGEPEALERLVQSLRATLAAVDGKAAGAIDGNETPVAANLNAIDRSRHVLLAVVSAAKAFKGDRHVAPPFAAKLRKIADALDQVGP